MRLGGSRTIVVHLPNNEVCKIDSVPGDVTAIELLAKLMAIEAISSQCKNSDTPVLEVGGEIIAPEAVVDDTDVSVRFVEKKREFWKAFLFLLLFCVSHVAPIVWGRYISLFYVISGYIFSLSLTGILCMVFKPSSNLLHDLKAFNPQEYVIVDVFVLLLKSFLPGFRLEQVLLR
jgi:hypothetical protein